MGVPATGTVQEQYSHHLRYDGVVPNPAPTTAFTHDYRENLYGHRSGVGNTTPWSTPPVRPTPATYQDTGTSSATAATTMTDATKAWVTNQWTGKTIFSMAAGGATTKMIVTSNTATVLTGASWTNGTPTATTLYIVGPDATITSLKFADNWQQQLRVLFNPGNL